MEDCDLREAATIIADCCDITLSDRGGEKGPEAKKRASEKPADKRQRPPGAAGARKKEPAAGEPENVEAEVEGTGKNEPLSFSLKLDPEHPYGRERGLSPEAIEHFEMGFCSRGMMKERWCIPIHSAGGELVAYAGRWGEEEPPEGVERYLLPPKFKKSLEFFNLHRAVALGAEHVTVVEGYFGVVRLHMMRVPAVALMGTSISEAQVELLVRAGVERVTLLLDGDQAGRKACERVLPLLARELFVRVGELPDGEAPDTISEEVLRGLVEPVSP